MTTTSEAKTRTITLTDRPPVRISEAAWPVIASARRHDGQIEPQANRRWYLTVRQHSDGRTIVYGVYDTVLTGGEPLAAGELLDAGEDIVAAIRRVGKDAACSESVIAACIADLPAEDLS